MRLYETLKRRWMAQGIERLELSTSFRARPSIQRAINAGFAPLMQGAEDGSQASYVALDEHRPEAEGRPSVVALPIPRPYADYGKITGKAIDECVHDAVGAFVEWLLRESGWTFEDPQTKETRTFESRDVCLLFRNTTSWGRNVVAPYAQNLEARSIPHVLVGGRAFRDREEVLAFATAIRAIEHPADTLSVYATLRGPFFGLDDAQLLAHAEEIGRLNPLAPRDPELLFDPARGSVAEALDVLRELHVKRSRRPIADTLARLLDATRAHAGIASWRNGEQALSNVLRVLDLARRFEAGGASSFRAFVEHLDERIESGEGVDAPVVEERAAGVRVMTVHKAKGLEFPVVVLCDPSLSREKSRPSAYVDAQRRLWAAPLAGCAPVELTKNREAVLRAEEAEEVRIAYVAATRARELLVVPCVGDERWSGWVDPLHRGLYPEGDRRDAEPAPGCPGFGEDSVFDRPPKAPGPSASVRPGLHRTAGGEVVWWDPSALPLGRVARGGLRGIELFAPDGAGGPAEIDAHHAWVEAREATLTRGAEPSWRVRSVTAAAHGAESTTHEPTIEEIDARPGRPSGKRFGTLVHALLAECPLDADEVALRAMAVHQGRLLDASPEEIDAAVPAAAAALAHPRLEAARASSDARRECPITVPLDDGTSAEGIIDLVYRDGDGWVVVDFKTDRERGEKVTHSVQLAIYARAVTAATGETVETVLLYV